MNKKIKYLALLLGAVIICLASEKRLMAQNSPIASKGNLMMETEEVKFYSDDIRYLKKEIDKLKSECD